MGFESAVRTLCWAVGSAACLMLWAASCAEAAATYYINSKGNDASSGTSPQTAWRTIEKVNGVAFAPGSQILFQGGQTFHGGLRFDAGDAGTPEKPVVVGSYGRGRATLDAGDSHGLRVENAGGFHVRNLNIVGSGRTSNHGSGVYFHAELPDAAKLPFVHIENVEVSGFGGCGVLIEGAKAKCGYRDVRISYVLARDNAIAGIYVMGAFDHDSRAYAHENVTVRDCVAHHNAGIADPKRDNTGSGIVLADVRVGLIEQCVAYENGWLCDSNQGGPVGIWTWDSDRVTIQRCESHHNHVAGGMDGGGFDLDGGATKCILQYNYSHDNDGAGYLLAQFPYARPFNGNIVRYNISQNDGRRNSYAGIHLWGEDGFGDTDIYNNTIFQSPSREGTPRALYFDTPTRHIRLFNNIFQTTGGLPLVESARPQAELRLLGNAYFASDGQYRFLWLGKTYTRLADWRAASGQERWEGKETGSDADPKLCAPGTGKTLDDTRLLTTLDAYRLLPDSPLRTAGLDLKRLFALDSGPRDFYCGKLPRRPPFSVGADKGR